MMSHGLYLHLRESHLPKSYLINPSAQDETPHYVFLCVETLDCARFVQKGHNLGLSFELEASAETALLSKFTANMYLRFWLWSQGSPRDSVTVLLAWIFQDQVFKTCVTIVYAKKSSLELTAGLQMGSHNGACIWPRAFTDNQGQCCVWPRAPKSSLLKSFSSLTPASEPLCHQLQTETQIFLSGSLCSGIALAVLSSNTRK